MRFGKKNPTWQKKRTDLTRPMAAWSFVLLPSLVSETGKTGIDFVSVGHAFRFDYDSAKPSGMATNEILGKKTLKKRGKEGGQGAKT